MQIHYDVCSLIKELDLYELAQFYKYSVPNGTVTASFRR